MQTRVPPELRGNDARVHGVRRDSCACRGDAASFKNTQPRADDKQEQWVALPPTRAHASPLTCLVIVWRALWWKARWRACSDSTPAWCRTSSSPSSSPRSQSFRRCGRVRRGWSLGWAPTLSTYPAEDLSTKSGLWEDRNKLAMEGARLHLHRPSNWFVQSQPVPKWFTPNCMSKPSSVFPAGHLMTPALFMSTSTRCSATRKGPCCWRGCSWVHFVLITRQWAALFCHLAWFSLQTLVRISRRPGRGDTRKR